MEYITVTEITRCRICEKHSAYREGADIQIPTMLTERQVMNQENLYAAHMDLGMV